jgi:Translin family
MGNYSRPLAISKFVKELSNAFQVLNLKNDNLRKRFDSIKYDVKKIEEGWSVWSKGWWSCLWSLVEGVDSGEGREVTCIAKRDLESGEDFERGAEEIESLCRFPSIISVMGTVIGDGFLCAGIASVSGNLKQ